MLETARAVIWPVQTSYAPRFFGRIGRGVHYAATVAALVLTPYSIPMALMVYFTGRLARYILSVE